MTMDRSPAIIAQVAELVGTDLVALAYRGLTLKGRILASTGAAPVVGDAVLAELVPSSNEYYVVAIVPP